MRQRALARRNVASGVAAEFVTRRGLDRHAGSGLTVPPSEVANPRQSVRWLATRSGRPARLRRAHRWAGRWPNEKVRGFGLQRTSRLARRSGREREHRQRLSLPQPPTRVTYEQASMSASEPACKHASKERCLGRPVVEHVVSCGLLARCPRHASTLISRERERFGRTQLIRT